MKRLLARPRPGRALPRVRADLPEKNCCTGRLSRPGANPTYRRGTAARAEQEMPRDRNHHPVQAGGGRRRHVNQLNACATELNVVESTSHIVLAPFEGQCSTNRGTSPRRTGPLHTGRARGARIQSHQDFQDFVKAAKAEPGKLTLGGSESTREPRAHSAQLRVGIRRSIFPQGTGDMTVRWRRQSAARCHNTAFASTQGQDGALSGGDGETPPAAADAPTFRDWA